MSPDFDSLGFDADLTNILRRSIARPFGIVLVTGPTGSGKTTTFYAALNEINTPERKIFTVEDPVEYTLAGVNQVPVKPQIGLTFAHALRVRRAASIPGAVRISIESPEKKASSTCTRWDLISARAGRARLVTSATGRGHAGFRRRLAQILPYRHQGVAACLMAADAGQIATAES
jgi:energy-coupling factor transporter ATP-binding protein EcfA2